MDDDKNYINDLKPKFRKRYGGLECRVYMVMENPKSKPININGPDDIYNLVRDEMAGLDREVLLTCLLNGLNSIIGVEMVSMGGVNSCVVTLREVFKSAILANASGIVLCHNHPSGSLEPSQEDIQLTNKIRSAGEMLGILIHDHLIISSNGGYKSIINQ